MSDDPKPTVVLVADDDPTILTMLSKRLSHRGYQVLTAIDGEQTLEQARQHRPDVILLDVMMPNKSGWEVIKVLRADEELRHVGIVILTAMGERVSHMTAALYGADACLDKPFNLDEVDAQIKRILAARSHG